MNVSNNKSKLIVNDLDFGDMPKLIPYTLRQLKQLSVALNMQPKQLSEFLSTLNYMLDPKGDYYFTAKSILETIKELKLKNVL